MKILEIHIQNFKGFDQCTFRLNEQFTVFIGENASGKTSVLDALAVAAGSFFIGIEGVGTRSFKKNEIRTVLIDGQRKPQHPIVIEAHGRFEGYSEPVTWKRDKGNVRMQHKDVKAIGEIAASLLEKSRKHSGVIFPVIAYHGTGRLWAEHDKPKFQKQKEGVIAAYTNCLSAKSSTVEFLSWFKTQEDSIRKFNQPLEVAHFNAFKETILGLLPDERWSDMAFDFKENDLAGIFTDNDGAKHKLAFSQLSDGFRNLIGLAADIAYRCIQLNPHLGERAVIDTPGIVLIDELDLHLHPNWQRRVVADLKRVFPKVQFVATTHSPFIVQSLESDELYNLDRVSDVELSKLTVDEIASTVMGTESPYGLENQELEDLSKQYLEILQEPGGKNKSDTDRQLDALEETVSDPAVRAFLKMQRLKKSSGH